MSRTTDGAGPGGPGAMEPVTGGPGATEPATGDLGAEEPVAGDPGPTRDDDWARSVSESLEVSPELLPYIPELLRDLTSLGCMLEPLVRLVRRAGAGPSSRVLDLCCGKGAASVALASELGCSVVGVDLFPPFLREARAAAEKAGVGHLCTFVTADAQRYLESGGGTRSPGGGGEFDGVVMAAAGAVLGGYGETVGLLRSAVRPGGWMLLEDGFLPEEFTGSLPPGYGYCRAHGEAVAALTSHGDLLAEEVVVARASVVAFNRTTTDLIKRRAEEVAKRHPLVAEGVRAYALEQEMWSAAAESVETVLWLLRRALSP